MASRLKDRGTVTPFRKRRGVRRFLPTRLLILSLFAAVVAFGNYLKHTALEQSWWVSNVGAPFEGAPTSMRPRALHGGDAMQRRGGLAISRRSAGNGAASYGRVTYVRDGDTIEVDGRPIRIATLDCGESGTIAGHIATRRMKALVSSERVTCSLTGERSYDRWIGSCRLASGQDIASVMIGEGLCRRWR